MNNDENGDDEQSCKDFIHFFRSPETPKKIESVLVKFVNEKNKFIKSIGFLVDDFKI